MIDTELENWQREWREHTEPLPELKKKIKRQNWRTAGAIVAICVCFVSATVFALRTHSAFLAGGAAGIAFASIVLGGYALHVRRGAWKPSANTTLAYAELTHKRAVARARILSFTFYFLLCVALLFSGFVGWNWRRAHPRDFLIDAALIAELFFIKWQQRRKLSEVQETKKLVDDIRE